jgi:hypothetical protein
MQNMPGRLPRGIFQEGVGILGESPNSLNADFILGKHQVMQLQLKLEVSERIVAVNADFAVCKVATNEA